MPAVMAQEKSRRSGCILMFVILVISVLLVAGSLFAIRWRGRGLVRDEIARIRSENLPATTAEGDSYYSIPEGRDDITEIWVQAVGTHSTGPFNNSIIQLNQYEAEGLPYVGSDAASIVVLPGEDWPALPAAKAYLAHYEDGLLKVHLAARQTGSVRYPVRLASGFAALLPHTQALRTPSRMLRLQALVRAHEGDAHGAFDSLMAILKAAQSLENEPLLISSLVHAAIVSNGLQSIRELTPCVAFTDEELQRFQTEIRRIRSPKLLHRALAMERAMGNDVFQNPGQMGHIGVDPSLAHLSLLSGPGDQLAYLDLMRRFIDAAKLDLPQSLDAALDVENDLKKVAGGKFLRLQRPLTTMFVPAVMASFNADARTHADCRITDVFIAVERFRRNHDRQQPPSLEALVPDFLPELPIDPFDGLPLRFRLDSTDVVIYSIGPDRKDNGGQVENDPTKEIVARFPLEPTRLANPQ